MRKHKCKYFWCSAGKAQALVALSPAYLSGVLIYCAVSQVAYLSLTCALVLLLFPGALLMFPLLTCCLVM